MLALSVLSLVCSHSCVPLTVRVWRALHSWLGTRTYRVVGRPYQQDVALGVLPSVTFHQASNTNSIRVFCQLFNTPLVITRCFNDTTLDLSIADRRPATRARHTPTRPTTSHLVCVPCELIAIKHPPLECVCCCLRPVSVCTNTLNTLNRTVHCVLRTPVNALCAGHQYTTGQRNAWTGHQPAPCVQSG